MKLGTKQVMNELDLKAIRKYKIPSVLLMEHAACRIYESIRNQIQVGRIAIVCGPGNNGGDGLALARLLHTYGDYHVTVILAAPKEKLSEDGIRYYEIIETLGISMWDYGKDLHKCQHILQNADLIVDALFGTGLSKPIEGHYKTLIEQINAASVYTLSVDIPSGIACDTGKVLGVAVQADCTLTFQLGKLGQYLYPGMTCVGQLHIVDIGIPKVLVEQTETLYELIDSKLIQGMLPERPTRSNKSTYGKVLVIGGQIGMSGAICMSGEGAMKVGAGMVTLAVPEGIVSLVDQKITEAVTIPLPMLEGHISQEAVPVLEGLLPRYDVVAIGPGIGRSEAIVSVLEEVLKAKKPCVIDADGLYALKDKWELVEPGTLIMTPHPGEMSALTGHSIEEILENPIEIATAFSKQHKVIVVLKLERIIIAEPNGKVYIQERASQAIAKGGSGDVLTGFITGMLAQNKKPLEAALIGSYLQGDTAKALAELKDGYSILPTDVLEHVGMSFKNLQG